MKAPRRGVFVSLEFAGVRLSGAFGAHVGPQLPHDWPTVLAHAVTALLGHADAALVLRRYGHTLADELAGAGAALSALAGRPQRLGGSSRHGRWASVAAIYPPSASATTQKRLPSGSTRTTKSSSGPYSRS